jgi:CDP-glucose 4,6-dehydratase
MLLAEKLAIQPEKFAQGWNFGPSEADAQPVSWIADRLVEEWGSAAKWEHVQTKNAPHEAHYLKLDCSKARGVLGWKPRLQLDQAIHWIVEWHKRFLKGEVADSICLSQIEQYLNL